MTDKISLTRRAITQGLALGLPAFSVSAAATTARAQSAPSSVPPGKDWEALAPEAAGFTREGLIAVERSIYALPTTSLMVVTSGKVVYRYGFTAQVSYLASARKSILSMLYGKYVANGTINLDRTIEELGIEEDKGLLPIEKTARVRDLLISSSGVYHPAGSPGGDETTPPRGSKQPGMYFHYNNWDFNVLGAIFEKLTGKTVFQAFGEDLAAPLQMQDYDPSRQRMMGYRTSHAIWPIISSCRGGIWHALVSSWPIRASGTGNRSSLRRGSPKARNSASKRATWPTRVRSATAIFGGSRKIAPLPNGLARF